jgi:hypothetical protein
MTEPIDLWIEALRSGAYRQTRLALRDNEGFCCLGVACEVAIEAGLPLKRAGDDGYSSLDGQIIQRAFLPRAVMEWLGLSTGDGRVSAAQSLSQLNDRERRDFNYIANFIDKYREELTSYRTPGGTQ